MDSSQVDFSAYAPADIEVAMGGEGHFCHGKAILLKGVHSIDGAGCRRSRTGARQQTLGVDFFVLELGRAQCEFVGGGGGGGGGV